VSVQKSSAELQKMARAARLVIETLDLLEEAAVPGATTADLDRIARENIEGAGARPAFLGYRGFPATLCASVNEEVVHGIPGPRKLRRGTSWASTWAASSTASSGLGGARWSVGEVSPRGPGRFMDTTRDGR